MWLGKDISRKWQKRGDEKEGKETERERDRENNNEMNK